MEDYAMNVRIKVADYLDYCRIRKELDEKTLKAYRIDLRQYFEFCDCDEPEKKEIETYIVDLHQRYKQKTVKRKLASIKAFYNYLEAEEVIDTTPFRKIRTEFKEAVTLPRIIPRSEIEQLLNYMYSIEKEVEDHHYRYWLRDMATVETFFAIGARVYEISNIKFDCIDLASGMIRIDGKGDKERYVQIGDETVLKLLQKYYQKNREAIHKSGYLFVNNRGKRFTEQSMRAMIRRYAQEAGISRRITPHMFRHSLATYLIEEGVDISCVQEIFGHSSIKTTRIYVHVAAGKQAEILRCKHPRKKMMIQSR